MCCGEAQFGRRRLLFSAVTGTTPPLLGLKAVAMRVTGGLYFAVRIKGILEL
ncbi:unnamed protein product [Ectocarpus sp. 6 AP-2014]